MAAAMANERMFFFFIASCFNGLNIHGKDKQIQSLLYHPFHPFDIHLPPPPSSLVGSSIVIVSLFLVVENHFIVNSVDVLVNDICTLFDEITLGNTTRGFVTTFP